MVILKGTKTVIPGLIIMDDMDCELTDNVRLAKEDDVYECVLEIQANYALNGKFII